MANDGRLQVYNILVIRCANVKPLHNLLKAIQFRETAWFSWDDKGMAVTVDEVQSVQALLTTERAFFTEYSVKPSGDKGAVKFCLNLALLCDCLNIFGCANSSVATAMRLVYAGDGHPVKLLLEERGIVADCEIKTVGVDEESEPPKLGESNADVVAKVVCKPQCLREVFSDLDSSSEIVEIRVSHQKPNFCFTTFGHAGTFSVSFDENSELIETFGSVDGIIKHNYRLSLLKPVAKAFHLASKISVRIDTSGFLEMTSFVGDGENYSFITFTCASEVDLEEENKENESQAND